MNWREQIASEKEVIYSLDYRDDAGRKVYFYLKVLPEKLLAFKTALRSGTKIDLTDYGLVLKKGFGFAANNPL